MSDVPSSHPLKPRAIKPPLGARCELCEKIASQDEMVLECPSCLKTFHVSCLKSYLEVNENCPSCKGAMVFLPPSMPSRPTVVPSKTLEPRGVPVSMSISLKNSFSLIAYIAGLVGGIFAVLSGIFISMIVFYIPFEPASEYIVQMPSNFMLIISAVMSLANLIIGYLIVVNSGRIRRGEIYGGATNLALGIIIFFVLNITFDTLQEFFHMELLWSLLVRTPIFTTLATLISGALGVIAHAGTLTRERM